MTNPNPNPSADFPRPAPAEPWLDALRREMPTTLAPAFRAPAASAPASTPAFAAGVLDAWGAAAKAASDDASQEPWLGWLATVDAHAPRSAAFVRRTAEAFAADKAHSAARRRVFARVAYSGLAAAVALAVGLHALAPAASGPTVAQAPRQASGAPADPDTGVLLAPLQASAEAWLEQRQQQVERQVATTLTQAKDKTSALLSDYAVPVRAARLLLAPAIPALAPVFTPLSQPAKDKGGDTGGKEPQSLRDDGAMRMA